MSVQIFFCPTPAVAESSSNGVSSKSRSVRPKNANGSRRSMGSPVGEWPIHSIGELLLKQYVAQPLEFAM